MGMRFTRPQLNHAKNFTLRAPQPDYDGYPVTASDSVDLTNGPTQALFVTGAGNVAVNLAGGGTATLTGLSAGQILDVAVTRVLATGTTATGIFALYNGG